MKYKKWIGTVMILSGLVLAGCSNDGNNKTTASKQVLNWTESSQISTVDLAQATDTLSFNVLMNTQEGLYRLNSKGTPTNALATKTDISKDGKTYTINLRQGVKWTNGDEVTAQDFVYSWR